jgi:uncharacterized protein YjiS (DUF1127 family)
MEGLFENPLIRFQGATGSDSRRLHPATLAWISVFDSIGLWMERARQRQTLASLPDHMLKDIGVNRIDAHREAGKVFWKA